MAHGIPTKKKTPLSKPQDTIGRFTAKVNAQSGEEAYEAYLVQHEPPTLPVRRLSTGHAAFSSRSNRIVTTPDFD